MNKIKNKVKNNKGAITNMVINKLKRMSNYFHYEQYSKLLSRKPLNIERLRVNLVTKVYKLLKG